MNLLTFEAVDSFGNILDRKEIRIEEGDMGPSEERLGGASQPVEESPPVEEPPPMEEPVPKPVPIPKKGLFGFGFLPFDPILDVPNLFRKKES